MYGYVPPPVRERFTASFFKEGAVADVMVTRDKRDGARALRVDGKTDASSQVDMPTQLGLAYLPRLLRPTAADVLVIGLGSGTTSGASLLFPGTTVSCVEIEPAVFSASRQFSDVNHRPERSSRFTITFDDARSFLQETDQRFDLIISEPSNPWMAGVSNLFTRQFYEAVRRHLKPGGLFAQWVQLYALSPSDYAMIARTLAGEFPHCALLGGKKLSAGDSDTILLGSASIIGPTRKSLRIAQSLVDSLPAVQSDLRTYFDTTDVFALLFGNIVLDEGGVRRLREENGAKLINTDFNLRLEFDAPRQLFQLGQTDSAMVTLKSILAAADPEQFAREFDAWGGTRDRSSLFDSLAGHFVSVGLTETAAKIIELGLVRDPRNARLLGAKIAFSRVDQAFFDTALPVILSASEDEANQLGMVLWRMGRFAEAAAIQRRLVALHPDSPIAWNNLATSYARLGKRPEAEEAFKKAISLDPFNDNFRKSYQSFLKGDPGQ
jgi:spermidine synthase